MKKVLVITIDAIPGATECTIGLASEPVIRGPVEWDEGTVAVADAIAHRLLYVRGADLLEVKAGGRPFTTRRYRKAQADPEWAPVPTAPRAGP